MGKKSRCDCCMENDTYDKLCDVCFRMMIEIQKTKDAVLNEW